MHNTDSITDIAQVSGSALAGAKAPKGAALRDILSKAETPDALTIPEAASLLSVTDEDDIGLMCDAAGRVKDAVFGPRVVLFAPLYLSNYCSNDCTYCGFRRSNEDARRRALSPEDAVEQARLLSGMGFKRLLLVAGEHPGHSGVEYLADVASAIYAGTDIRILHVNCAPLSTAEFKTLKGAGYGVYQCFQETYHQPTYAAMHPTGKKRDYAFRLAAMDRALEAGFGDVGIGALLGLYDHRFDALATIAHSRHLEERFGAAAHTISVPRLRHAEGAALAEAPHPVSDLEFKKIVAVYRLSVPYAGVVVSTREPALLREEVLTMGASQVSAGSSTEPGGYGENDHSQAQFDVSDHRDLGEMVGVIARMGLLPSLCTSCYRSGRQGHEFRELAGSGAIKDFCTPNAILSLKEYIIDNAGRADTDLLNRIVARFTETVEEPLKRDLLSKLAGIEKGGRDVHY